MSAVNPASVPPIRKWQRRRKRAVTIGQAIKAVKRQTDELIRDAEYRASGPPWSGYQWRRSDERMNRLKSRLDGALARLQQLVLPSSEEVRGLCIKLLLATEAITDSLNHIPRGREWRGMAALRTQRSCLSALEAIATSRKSLP